MYTLFVEKKSYILTSYIQAKIQQSTGIQAFSCRAFINSMLQLFLVKQKSVKSMENLQGVKKFLDI